MAPDRTSRILPGKVPAQIYQMLTVPSRSRLTSLLIISATPPTKKDYRSKSYRTPLRTFRSGGPQPISPRKPSRARRAWFLIHPFPLPLTALNCSTSIATFDKASSDAASATSSSEHAGISYFRRSGRIWACVLRQTTTSSIQPFLRPNSGYCRRRCRAVNESNAVPRQNRRTVPLVSKSAKLRPANQLSHL